MSVLVSYSAKDFNSFTILTHRAIVTLLALAPFTLRNFLKNAKDPILWKRGFLASISIALFFYALQSGSPASVAAYFGITPACVVFLYFIFLRETTSRLGIVSILLVIAGVALVKLPNTDELSLLVFGICLLGSLFRAGSYTIIRSAKTKHSSNLWVFTLSICILVLTTFSGKVQWNITIVSNWVLWAISISSILMQLSLVYSYQILTGARATALEESNTVWILLFQVFLIGMATSIYEILGIGLIIIGNILVSRKS